MKVVLVNFRFFGSEEREVGRSLCGGRVLLLDEELAVEGYSGTFCGWCVPLFLFSY